MPSYRPSGPRLFHRFALVLALSLGCTATGFAQTEPDHGLARLRRLLATGQMAAVEAGADSILDTRPQGTRADSLLRSDAAGLWIEVRIRQGSTLTSPTPDRIEELVRLRERLFETNDLEIALGQDFLGILERERQNAAKAQQAFERALRIRESRLGPRHPETAKSLNQVATLAFAAHDFARARTLLSRALEIYESQLPPEHPALGAPLLNLSLARIALDDTTGVRNGLQRAVRIFEKNVGPNHPLAMKALQSLGDWSLTHGAWSDAAATLGLARERCELYAPGGDEHFEALSALARLHLATGQADSARLAADAAQRIVDARQGRESARAASVITLRADVARAAGSNIEAAALYEQAVNLLARVGDADSLLLADALEGAALLDAESDTPARALPRYDRALRIEHRQRPLRTRELAHALMGRAGALRGLSQFDSATAGYLQARNLIERTLPSGHPLRADPFMGLAGLARDMGDVARARAYADTALTLRRQTLPPSHPRIVESLHLLGLLEKELGHQDAAKDLLERGLALVEGRPAQIAERASLLNSLGVMERQRGHLPQARAYFERALEHESGAADVPWRVRALALRNLGSLANAADDHTTAASRYAEARILHETHGDAADADLASIIVGAGNAAKGLGHYVEAESLYRRAILIHGRLLGWNHPSLALDHHNLAATLLETGALRSALDTALIAEDVSRQHLRLVASGLPEEEALHYAAGRVHGLDIALTAAARLPDTTAWRKAWDGVIRSRALVLDEMAERRRTIADTRDPELGRLATALAAASDRLAHLTVRGRAGMSADKYLTHLDAARRDRDAAERALAERSDSFRRGRARRELGFAQVAAALPEDVSLVGYVRFTRMETEHVEGEPAPAAGQRRSVEWYGAFLLSDGDLRFVMLAPATRIEDQVARWQRQAAEGWRGDPALAEASYRVAGAALRETIWDSLSVHLRKSQRVFVVPDGVLQLVNLATLPIGTRDYLIEDGPRLHLLSTERDLVEFTAEASTGTGMLTTASVDFMSGRVASRSEAGANGSRHRGAQCSAFQSMWFDSLPGTRVEQGNVARMWRKYNARLATAAESKIRRQENSLLLQLTGVDATEQQVRVLAPGRAVLHLATHGFFLDRTCAGSTPSDEESEDEESIASLPMDQQSPLLLSGLALAGANLRDKAPAGDNDGILTAEEIASLDLSGVDWAVLSACQTGLGEVRAGEGVFGLRRAFEVAGARTLIMTLWSVDDRASALWMESLFERRLRGRRSTMDAVHDATLDVLKDQRSQGKHTHPYFWGPFVAVGDWK